jgi:hypothetical protein
MKKLPLAQSDLRLLISRESMNKALKTLAAVRLASTFEQAGQFALAVKTLNEAGSDESADISAETARLAWLAYQADHTEASRKIFIKSASLLLDRFPQSDSADQFRLLMAEDYSEQGEYSQSLQWIEDVPAGSSRYLQAQAAKVLVLSRQYKSQAAGGRSQASQAETLIANQVEKACENLLVLASAKQKNPEKIESWTLSEDQMKLLSGAILSAADVLSDPLIDKGDRARKMLDKYRPILNKFQKTSKSSLAVQINMLVQTASPAGKIEAINLALKMLDEKQLSVEIMADTTIFVLGTVHQAVLDTTADLSAKPGDLALANLNLAKQSSRTLLDEKTLSKSSVDRLRTLYIVASADAGDYPLAKDALGRYKPENGTEPVDLSLAKIKLEYSQKQYAESATATMQLLQTIPPSDIRYWHALIMNLRSHLALGSDHDQIAAAILARRQEYPNLGSPVTREELEKILHLVESR